MSEELSLGQSPASGCLNGKYHIQILGRIES